MTEPAGGAAAALVLRGGVGTVLIVLAVSIRRVGRGLAATPWLAAAAVCAAAHLVSSVPGAPHALGPAFVFLAGLSLAAPPVVWVASRQVFDDRFAARTWHHGLIGALVLLGWWQLGVLGGPPDELWGRAATATSIVLAAGLYIDMLRRAWGGRGADLIEGRRLARAVFGSVLAVQGGVYLAIELWLDGLAGQRLALLNLLVIGAVSLWACWRVWNGGGFVRWLAPSGSVESTAEPAPEDRALLDALDAALRSDDVIRDSGLSVPRLAALLGTEERRVRAVLHRQQGHKTFDDFLKAYRSGLAG